MNFKDITFAETQVPRAKVKITDDVEVEVRGYLPIDEKGELITWVAECAVDEKTGCFSPLRTEAYFSLAILKWYAGIEIDIEDASIAYDTFEQNHIFNAVISAIPSDEYEFLKELVIETTEDIARYNGSLAGMLAAMKGDASDLNNQVDSILESIRNREGLEQLAVIKDMVGTD